MAKAKATKTKPAAPRNKPAKKATKRAASKPAKATKKSTGRKGVFGGMAKGIAWLGDKVRSVMTKSKSKKKKKEAKAKKKPAPKRAKKGASEATLVTITNPLP